jgi:hypothetical protein
MTTDDRRSTSDRRLLGGALVAVGVLALLGTLGLAPALSNVVGVALFAALGVAALALARRTGSHWAMAAAFPAFGLALAILLPGDAGGAAFLWSLAAGFLSLFLAERSRWWALIPSGVLLTLGTIAAWGGGTGDATGGVLFFLGLALTFAAVWKLPPHPQAWAVYPAAALAGIAVLVGTMAGGWLLPLALIAVGVYLVVRAQRTSSV